MVEEKLPFIFTSHLRERYQQRILEDKSEYQVKNIDSMIARDIHEAKENRTYLTTPRYVLHLYEKYGSTDGIRVYETKTITFITKREKGEGFRRVLTCWKRTAEDFYFKTFANSALTNTEIYTRIAILKTKRK